MGIESNNNNNKQHPIDTIISSQNLQKLKDKYAKQISRTEKKFMTVDKLDFLTLFDISEILVQWVSKLSEEQTEIEEKIKESFQEVEKIVNDLKELEKTQ